MKVINFKNHKIKLYDSIDEMPIINFQKYNKYVLIDSELGSDIDSVDEHIINIAKYIKSDNKKQAMQELQNLRQNMHMIVNEISPKYLAFATLIHSIDDEEQKDLSDSNLKEIIEFLCEMPHSFIVDILAWLKKKVFSELETYFPNEFSSGAKEKEAYSKLKNKIRLQLQEIIEETDKTFEIAEIDKLLFEMHKPKSFNGNSSEEIKYDKQFESACVLISQKTNLNAKKMTVLEFYNTLADLKKQAELEKKAYSKYKH